MENRPPRCARWLRTASRVVLRALTLAMGLTCLLAACPLIAQDKAPTPAPGVAKVVGTIKSLQANSIIVTAEAGGDVTALLSEKTKIVRIPPGEKDLKNATVLQSSDLQSGDRILVRGAGSADGKTISALSVIVMKQADVAAKRQHDRDEWQKRGVGGLVTKVDAATSTITISSASFGGSKNVAVHIVKDTMLRRYAPDSVKFDDAKPAPLDQVKAGDQLRALGTRTADGSELAAEEVVSGSFRNIAGTIKAIDVVASTMTVQDAISKAAVTVKVAPDSQMKKLPPEMAQRIAMRLKGAAAGGAAEQARPGAALASVAPASTSTAGGDSPRGIVSSGPGSGGPGAGGAPDMQRMLARLPNSTLADLQKGDAVMIVSTAGSPDSVTAITLLAGVDAILTAAPNRSASSLLSPWSLNGGGGGEGEGAQ